MQRKVALTLMSALALAAIGACAGSTPRESIAQHTPHPPGDSLRAFRSEQEWRSFYAQLAKEAARLRREEDGAEVMAYEAPSSAPPALAVGEAAGASADAITNVQHAGVDEGGIVKSHGDFLVMLRRGRLFTVRVGGDDLTPVSAVDAYGPGLDPGGAWYDEMLIAGDIVAVIGYSYARGGTEVGLFHLDPRGRLTHRNTYHLRSNDYYSSRNYASRLVEGKLVFYTPLYLPLHVDDPEEALPALRRWRPGGEDGAFEPILSPTRIYRPERRLTADDNPALNTVTRCDLTGGEMDCEATAVLGPASRVFYVSPTSVYVWVSSWAHPARQRSQSLVYRLPLAENGPSALGVVGTPVDQFSFLESADEHLQVLVQSDAYGEGMWGSERADGDLALLRVPLSSFGDGSQEAPASAYRDLPEAGNGSIQNRYVGDYLLYGAGGGWGAPREGARELVAVRWRGGQVTPLPLSHAVDRIEAMGMDAVVVGGDGSDLHFSAVRLRTTPTLAGRYTMQNAAQGETRSHGFFYRPDGRASGMLGLPVRGGGRPGYEHLFNGSASVLYLRNQGLEFSRLGQLESDPGTGAEDACRASCVDWYGNARPIFLRGRIFALLGYELVEGRLRDGRLTETRRISYLPDRIRQAAVD